MSAAPFAETERLVLHRAWTLDDAEEAFAMYGDPEVVRHIGNQLMPDVAAMRARLEVVRARYASYGDLVAGAFPARDRRTGELVGSALLKFASRRDAAGALVDTPDLEIGWHVARRCWGRGYATEMGRKLVELGFAHHATEVLHAVVEPPNVASMAVARKVGMEHVGRTDRYYGLELEHFVVRRAARPPG